MKAHVEECSEDHLRKTWSEFLKTKQELHEVTCEINKIGEIKDRVETLQLEKRNMKMSLQKNNKEICDLKLAEKKLEVENMSLRREVNDLRRQLAEGKTKAVAENRSLRELLQSMKKKLEAIEQKEASKVMYKRAESVEVPVSTSLKVTVLPVIIITMIIITIIIIIIIIITITIVYSKLFYLVAIHL